MKGCNHMSGSMSGQEAQGSSQGQGDQLQNVTALYPQDTGTLTGPQRRAFAELIKGPYVSSERKPEVFTTISDSRETLAQQLNNLFLTLIVDDTAGVAYTRVWSEDVEDKRALLRTMPLTFMDTVILLHLRRELITSNPNERTIVDEQEVMEATVPYQPTVGTDRVAQYKKFMGSWNKMKNHSIVMKTPTEGRWEVSPVLRILFSAEEIAAVTRSYEAILKDSSHQEPAETSGISKGTHGEFEYEVTEVSTHD